jgi:hypothetical protein
VRKAFAQLALSIISLQSTAQIVHSPVRAHYVQLGTYSKEFCDVFSFTNNQAALSALKTACAGVYGEQRFLLKEASMYSMAVAVPAAGGCFGLQANFFGFSDYNESQIGMAYGKHLGKMADIGVQFNYYDVRITGYGSTEAVNFEVGAIFHLSEKFHLGLHAYNPVGGKFRKNTTEKLASVYALGAGYDASKQVFITAEIIKEENKPVSINAGLQYVFAKQFFARTGIESEPSSPYAGVGLLWNLFRLDVSVSYHLQLGFTPGMVLIYYFKERGNR